VPRQGVFVDPPAATERMEQRLISKEFRQRGSSLGTVSWFNQSLTTQQIIIIIIIIPYSFVISELTSAYLPMGTCILRRTGISYRFLQI
jgi:hypothetical protein